MRLGDPENEHVLVIFYHEKSTTTGAFGIIPGLTKEAAELAMKQLPLALTAVAKTFTIIDTGHGFPDNIVEKPPTRPTK